MTNPIENIKKQSGGRPKKDEIDKAKNMLISLPIDLYNKTKDHPTKNSRLVQELLIQYFKKMKI
jgi:hypothetical protein